MSLGLRQRALGWLREAPGALRTHVRAHRSVLIALALLVAAGIGLRLWLMLAYRPAFLGYPDTGVYINGARESLFEDRFRVVGYSAFLRWVQGLNANLSFTILVQHALGVASALLMYATVVRAGASRWLALVPAALVLLCGGMVLVEHAVLSESVYIFLVSAGVYATVRALPEGGFGWPLAAGTLIALSFCVRLAGVVLVPVVVLWLIWAGDAPLRRRLAHAGAAALVALLVGFGYVQLREERSGQSGFTTTGAFNLYGPVATFADCDEFDPPDGTEFLCDSRPKSERPGAYEYVFGGSSPAVQQIGEPQLQPPRRGGMDKLRRFTRAAILAQPVDYARSVGDQLVRYVDPGAHTERGGAGLTPEQLADHYVDRQWTAKAIGVVAGYYDAPGTFVKSGRLEAVREYERATRVQGPAFALLALLAIAAPFVTSGRLRRPAVLLSATALALVLVPAATFVYDYRLALPAVGPLGAAAALGAGGAMSRLRGYRARRGSAPAAPG